MFKTIYLRLLRFAAKLQLAKNSQAKIVGVTGSSGKTGTVQAIALVLAEKYRVQRTIKGNSETGLPFELLKIPVKNYTGLDWLWLVPKIIWQLFTYWPNYEWLIVEMGIDSDQSPKNMGYLLSMIQPEFGVLLNVSSVHGQNFDHPNTIQAIAQEKGKLLQSLPEQGLAVYSQDHPPLIELASKLSVKTKNFSLQQKADLQLLEYEVSLAETSFTFINQQDQFQLTFSHQLHLKEAFGNFATALLIGLERGIDLETGIRALQQNYQHLPGRMSLLAGINGSKIIDSSYNSSLKATIASLKLLHQIKVAGKKIAVLGDMREIGPSAQADHEQLAQVALNHADELFLIGPLMKAYALLKLKKLDPENKKIHWFLQAPQAIKSLKNIVSADDLILVKGSQNTIFLELIVQALLANPTQDKALLCRQSPYWDRQRSLLFSN